MAKKRKFTSTVRLFVRELNDHVEPHTLFELTFVPEEHQHLIDDGLLIPYKEQELAEEASNGTDSGRH